jgi:hypothetical protein
MFLSQQQLQLDTTKDTLPLSRPCLDRKLSNFREKNEGIVLLYQRLFFPLFFILLLTKKKNTRMS